MSKNIAHIRALILYTILGLSVTGLGSCVYYNTFHNAQKSFNNAEKARKSSRGRGKGNISEYRRAIDKSLKVVDNYPNSKYYDDALHVLTVSYYYTDQYSKSERRARELLANYPESEYARDATLYMAKSKLQLKDRDEAMAIFQSIFDQQYDKAFKTEAALALGTFYFDNSEYEEAQPFLLAIRDSLGSDEEKRMAQTYLAEGFYERYQFSDALSAYLQLLGMDPDPGEQYTALFQSADCSYHLQRIQEGQDYLSTLMDDDLFFDSLGVLRLKMAEGYEYSEDVDQAVLMYEEIAEQEANRKQRARAYWRLGLIYQFDYDQLEKAKEYYDSTAAMNRSSDIGKQALQRSSDIGKITDYARTINIDSTITQEAIDEAAYVQYQLAELYWFQLNKPDTAILEMQYVIDSFASAFDAPKAMIALSQMVRDSWQDSLAADSVLHEMLRRYPTSDYVPEALKILGLKGTAADTGYAGLYFSLAEHYLADVENPDSARINYQYVVDSFPDSKYYLQSRFALLWLTEMYDSPGDSSLIFAYNEFVDSFPQTEWANIAKRRTKYRPKPKISDDGTIDSSQLDDEDIDPLYDDKPGETGTPHDEEIAYIDPLDVAYIGPDGTKLQLLNMDPIRIQEEFIYPQEAYRDRWEGDLYFQILLDFSGEVDDYDLKMKSPNEEINRRAEESLASMTFEPSRIPPELQGVWLVYKFRVYLPDHLR